MEKISILILFSLLFISCASNKNSYKFENEKTKIELHTIDNSSQELAGSAAFALIAPQVIDWGFSFFKTQIKKEEKKYTQKYSAKKNDSMFYFNPSITGEKAKLNYSGFSIKRLITEKNKEKIASEISFNFHIDKTNQFLIISPTSIMLDKSKAKLKSNDSLIDIIINVKLKSIWSTDKKIASKEIIDYEFNLKNIQLGVIDNETKKPKIWEIKNKKSTWLPAPPFSSLDNEAIDNGKFIIEVSVTETDNYGKRIEKFSKKFDENGDFMKKLIKNYLGLE